MMDNTQADVQAENTVCLFSMLPPTAQSAFCHIQRMDTYETL